MGTSLCVGVVVVVRDVWCRGGIPLSSFSCSSSPSGVVERRGQARRLMTRLRSPAPSPLYSKEERLLEQEAGEIVCWRRKLCFRNGKTSGWTKKFFFMMMMKENNSRNDGKRRSERVPGRWQKQSARKRGETKSIKRASESKSRGIWTIVITERKRGIPRPVRMSEGLK